MKVVYSPRAISDLGEIADYLVPRSPTGARAVEERIQRTVWLLSEFPGSGRALSQRSMVRVIPIGRYPYLIFYSISANELTILHIRHGARRPLREEDF